MKRATAKSAVKPGPCERAIREYFGGILRGEITACGKMKQAAAIVLQGMDNTDPLYPYHYREEYAQKHVRFIESFCRLPSGRLGHWPERRGTGCFLVMPRRKVGHKNALKEGFVVSLWL